jgi:sn-glycerol 3-phosphate transport system substrate-binding protein
MKRRSLLAGTAALVVAPAVGRAAEKTKIVWWHAMTAALGDEVNRIVDAFNQSQDAVELTAIYKGQYPDVLTATIAAFRAGQAPHLVQIFEVGTGSMLAAGKATKQVWELVKETGAEIDPKAYIPAVRGYYSLSDGRMASMPFNSSTALMWYSKDAFRKAGLDPDKPPETWPEVVAAARAIKDKSAAPVPMTTSWPTWIQLEQYSALHNLPFASKDDGFEGLDAQLEINSRAHVKHIERLLDMAKEEHSRCRPRERSGPIAGVRRCRNPLQFVRRARQHGKERQVRLGDGVSSVRSGDHQDATEFHHRRRQRVDDDRTGTHAGGIQGGGDVPAVPWQA